MQSYDFLMLAVLVGAAAFGFMKGMAWQIASLASILVSYCVALKFSPQLAPVFGDSEPWNKYVAMLVIYIACSFVVWLIFRVVSQFIDRVRLKEFDRQMGALLGIAKGVLFCVAITFFAVTLLPDEKKEAVLESRSGHYIGVMLTKAESIVPPEFRESVGPLLHRVTERINPNHEHDRPGAEAWPSILPDGVPESAGRALQNSMGGLLDDLQPGAAPDSAPRDAPSGTGASRPADANIDWSGTWPPPREN